MHAYFIVATSPQQACCGLDEAGEVERCGSLVESEERRENEQQLFHASEEESTSRESESWCYSNLVDVRVNMLCRRACQRVVRAGYSVEPSQTGPNKWKDTINRRTSRIKYERTYQKEQPTFNCKT